MKALSNPTSSVLKYLGELGVHFEVYRNDELTVEDIKRHVNPFYLIFHCSNRLSKLKIVMIIKSPFTHKVYYAFSE